MSASPTGRSFPTLLPNFFSKDTSVSEYLYLNPAIEVVEIKNSKNLPQIEQPVEFAKQADIFLDM